MFVRVGRGLAALPAALVVLAGAGAVAGAETYVARDVAGPSGQPFVLSVPSIDVVDANLSEAAIRQIFAEDISVSAAALAGLDAGSITIPELRMTDTAPGTAGEPPGTLVLTDIALGDVHHGLATSFSIGGMTLMQGADRVLSLGAMEVADFDAAALFGLYGLMDPAGSGDLRQIYGRLSVNGGDLKSPEVSCSIGPITAGAVSARPLRSMSMADARALMERTKGTEHPAPADVVALMHFYTDLFTAYETGPVTYAGLTCDGTNPEGHKISIAVGPLGIDGYSAGHLPQISLGDLKVDDATEGLVQLGALALKPIDLSGPLAALKAQGEALTLPWIEQNMRKLIPDFGGFSVAGLSADVADPQQPGARIKFAVGNVDLSLDDYVNGVPSNVGFSVSGLHVTIPPGNEGDALIALGYGDLDLDASLTLHWDREAQTIFIDALSLRGANAGAIGLSASLGGATPELFSDDPVVATRALSQLTLLKLTLDLDNAGLVPKLMSIAAAQQNVDEPSFRATMAAMVQGVLLIGLAGKPESSEVAQAVTDFLNGAPHLSIVASADGRGLGMEDFMAAADDPTKLLRELTISAKGSAVPAAVQSEPTPAPAPVPAPEQPAPTPEDAGAAKIDKN